MMNPSQTKFMLKNKATIMQSHDVNLFGKNFHQHLAETVEERKSNQRRCLSKICQTNTISCKRDPLEVAPHVNRLKVVTPVRR